MVVRRPAFMLLVAAVTASSAAAQVGGARPGSVLESVRSFGQAPEKVPADSLQLRIDGSNVSKDAAPEDTYAPRLRVRRFVFDGNTLYDEERLRALVADAQDRDLTLGQIHAVADHVAAFYREQGYTLAQAVVPAQEVRDGEVLIRVIEAQLGRVLVQRDDTVRLSAERISAVLAPLVEGKPLHMPTLERALLVLSDFPGISVESVLRAGEQSGTVDLVVSVAQGDQVAALASADNFGNRYSGQQRYGLRFDLDDLWGLGDRLTFEAMRTTGDLQSLTASWDAPLGAGGLRSHAAISRVDYRLGGPFDALDIKGSATRYEFGLRYPLMRSRAASTWAFGTLSHTDLDERIGVFGVDTPKRVQALQAGLRGDWRDGWGGGGATLWQASLTLGHLELRSAEDADWDRATAGRAGSFAKLNLDLDRLQRLDDSWSLAFKARAQLASRNLDASEKFYLGGPTGVRAYESGEAGGDQGILGSLELRRAIFGGLYAFGFIDGGRVRINRHAWNDDDNSLGLWSYGAGAHWDLGRYGYLRAVYAARPPGQPRLSDLNTGERFWLSASLAPGAVPALVAAAFPAAGPTRVASTKPIPRSNVRFYGTINMDVQVATRNGATPQASGRGATPSAAPTGVDSGTGVRMVSNSSNWGIRGSESLGAGTRVWYQIESSLDMRTGEGEIAARNTGVGLQGRHWGTLMGGQWDSPYKSATSGFDPFGGTQVTAYYNILGTPGFGVGSGGTSSPIKTATDRSSSAADASFARRQKDSLQYWSPSWNGWSVRAMVAPGGQKLSEHTPKPLIWAGSLTWRNGPLLATAAYEQHDNFFGVASLFSRGASGRGVGSRIGPTARTESRDRGIKLGIRYDVSEDTRLSLIWERLSYSQSGVVPASAPTLVSYSRDAVWLGVRHRVGPVTLQGSAGYADQGKCRVASTDPAQQGCSTDGLEAYMLSLGARYSLSSRTDLYVQYARIFNGHSASYNFSPGGIFGAGVGSDLQACGVGVIHRF